MPVRTDQQRIPNGVHGGARLLGKTDANGVSAVVEHHRQRGGLALENGAGIQFHLLGGEAGARGDRWIDVEERGRTADGVLDAVEHVHHSGNLLDGVADLRRPRAQQVGVLREELDGHRFGRAGEIADHVLQQLHELDVQHRFGFRDLGAHVGDHLVAAAAALAFQLDRDIAGVGFGDGGQAELQAGAPRSALHLGDGAQDLLHVGDHAVGLFERRAGRHDVVDDEAAFVHGGQQVGPAIAVTDVGAADQQDAENRQQQRMFEGHPQHALVGVHEPARHAAVLLLGVAAGALADEVVAEGGSPGQGQGERSEQRHAHGDGQRAEEHAGDAGDGNQRQEHHDGGDGRADQRNADLADGAADGLGARLALIAMHHDVLHHHDGVVDHQSHGRGQTAQGHQVEALAHDPQGDEGHRDGGGNHQPGHQRCAPVAQEQHHDEGGQDQADQDSVAHAADGVVDHSD